MEKGIYMTTIIYTNVLKLDQRRFTLTCLDLSWGKLFQCEWGLEANMNFVLKLNKERATSHKVKRTIM